MPQSLPWMSNNSTGKLQDSLPMCCSQFESCFYICCCANGNL